VKYRNFSLTTNIETTVNLMHQYTCLSNEPMQVLMWQLARSIGRISNKIIII
jgi:hypothetical protein